jgi:hypothetical protein
MAKKNGAGSLRRRFIFHFVIARRVRAIQFVSQRKLDGPHSRAMTIEG